LVVNESSIGRAPFEEVIPKMPAIEHRPELDPAVGRHRQRVRVRLGHRPDDNDLDIFAGTGCNHCVLTHPVTRVQPPPTQTVQGRLPDNPGARTRRKRQPRSKARPVVLGHLRSAGRRSDARSFIDDIGWSHKKKDEDRQRSEKKSSPIIYEAHI
jgi:hypothetical protein